MVVVVVEEEEEEEEQDEAEGCGEGCVLKKAGGGRGGRAQRLPCKAFHVHCDGEMTAGIGLTQHNL